MGQLFSLLTLLQAHGPHDFGILLINHLHGILQIPGSTMDIMLQFGHFFFNEPGLQYSPVKMNQFIVGQSLSLKSHKILYWDAKNTHIS